MHKIIPLDEPVFRGKEKEYLVDCIESGWVSWQGKYLQKFEEKFANYCGSKYAISTCTGTCALILALKALGVGEGDEVIVPTMTFSAPVFAASELGARVVFVDSAKNRFYLDPNEVSKKISDRTKAIIPVHLYGYPCDMDSLLEVSRGIPIIEDAAEAVGATYKSRKVGSIGDLGVFSFHNKGITTGEGGMITTNSEELMEKILSLKNPSPNNRTNDPICSLNYRMSNLGGAIGLAQLELLEENIKIKRKNAKLYADLLEHIEWIDFLVEEDEGCRSVYWRYTIKVEDPHISREKLQNELNKKEIEARAVFCPMHRHPHYKNYGRDREYPNANYIQKVGLDLPSSCKLTSDQISYIAEVIENVATKGRNKHQSLRPSSHTQRAHPEQ